MKGFLSLPGVAYCLFWNESSLSAMESQFGMIGYNNVTIFNNDLISDNSISN